MRGESLYSSPPLFRGGGISRLFVVENLLFFWLFYILMAFGMGIVEFLSLHKVFSRKSLMETQNGKTIQRFFLKRQVFNREILSTNVVFVKICFLLRAKHD